MSNVVKAGAILKYGSTCFKRKHVHKRTLRIARVLLEMRISQSMCFADRKLDWRSAAACLHV